VVWVQDLVLDAGRAVFDGAAQARALGALRGLESYAVRCADRVISCSPGFVDHLVAHGADPARIDVVPNWVDVDRFPPAPEPAGDGVVRFLYTGNIGYTQGFETLFAATELAGDGIAVDVVGGGNYADAARRLAPPSVCVRPPVARDAYPGLLASAHALVVLQRRAAANVNFPSKIASYLASGRPVVAAIGLDTPAAAVLEASGGALVVPPEDPAALAAAMQRLRDDPALRRELGARARAYAVDNLAQDHVLPRLANAIVGPDELEARASPRARVGPERVASVAELRR
jgi:colanic acid biosynthesis glycosyl transferase WcaI